MATSTEDQIDEDWDYSPEEEAEDIRDVRLALEDVRRNGTTSFAEIKREFGLDDDGDQPRD